MQLSRTSKEKVLPKELRERLLQARLELGLNQSEVGRRVGLPQVHISNIERGKVVPRYDTLLEIVHALGMELVLVPREVVPAVRAIVQDASPREDEGTDRPLYALEDDEDLR